ncbi:tetratricopeptide repeat protein [Bradyrhizobium sp. 61]|uniref:tetratricopeptide repeat protein n=1 Tax=unclassified Bradyrhizobium TaxID=2631580 RepID=UPI001FFBDC41|nr:MULTISPECIES: tetratricopeptide repeat protein [unclassified Bradyrhizobium]MCK1282053.1 tetratricopeptide repeat protein [Bradyrhizobium sp. 61]MCK1449008.1 tetratricopeptide repeat protein [Bradyrhizobium sp. 48]MCK1457459.1 tetratricopeptide repeat protein [Bradyrhizobium sp. 2]
MITAMIRLVTLGTFAAVLLSSPALAAGGGGGGGGGGISSTDPYAGAYADQRLQPQPVYPKRWGTKATHKGRKPNNQSSIGDPAFAAGYRVAYDTIYERNDYATAIAELKSLGHDDHPNVANLIGYSYRKLGDYEQSQVWYERALKADPNHVLTWQYYGLWQLERGNREQALYHLSRIAAICGTDCEEYRSLAAALDKPTGTALAY